MGIVSCLILASCAGGGPNSPEETAQSAPDSSQWGLSEDSENEVPDFTGTTLTVLSHPTMVSAVYGKGELIEEWERLTGGKVDVVTGDTSEIIQRATVEFLAHSGRFDIVQPETSDVNPAYLAGFEPLDAYIANAPEEWDYEDFLPGLVRQTEFDDVTYGVPLRWGLSFYYYRKDLFATAGIEPPTTLDDLDHAVRTMHAQDPDVYAIVQRGVIPEELDKDWLSFFYAAGGQFLEDDGTKCGLNSPAGIKAVEMFAGWYKDGMLPPDFLATSRDQEIGLFQQRRAAQSVMFSSWYAQLIDPEGSQVGIDELGWSLHPADPGFEGVTRIGPRMTGITADSEHKDAAWHFTMFITSKANQEREALEWGNSPQRASTVDGEYGERYPVAIDWMKATERAVTEPAHENLQQMLAALGRGLVKVIGGNVSAQEGMDAVCTEVESLL